MTDRSGTAVEHEVSDAEPRLIAWLAAGIAAFLLASPLVLRLSFPDALHRRVVVGKLDSVPSPRLQVDPRGDLRSLRLGEEGRLSGYGWVDRQRNIVRIPVDRAMSLILDRGLPGWEKP